jgi:uncharacterized small protein (DUF1192 family)
LSEGEIEGVFTTVQERISALQAENARLQAALAEREKVIS